MMRHQLPPARAGMTIGLFGGSFDPPHMGHVHITREALRRLRLDRVWWLVTPGNPLKPRGPAAIEVRMQAARRLMQHPRVVISDIERHIGTRWTVQTLSRLRALYPGVRFVWIMGADNLASMHRWDRWEAIMEGVPIAVFDRPGQRVRARRSKAALRFAEARLRAGAARALGRSPAPAWVFLSVPMRDISSTRLRQNGAAG